MFQFIQKIREKIMARKKCKIVGTYKDTEVIATTFRSVQENMKPPQQLTAKMVDNVFVMDLKTAGSGFDAHPIYENIPTLNNKDPFYKMIVQKSHVINIMGVNNLRQLHTAVHVTHCTLLGSKLKCYAGNQKKNISNILHWCPPCRKQNPLRYPVSYGLQLPLYEGIEPMAEYSIDDLGEIEVVPHTSMRGNQSRSVVPLIGVDLITGFMMVELMDNKSTEQVIAALIRIFSHYGIPKRLLTDAGTSLLKENLNPVNIKGNELFTNMEIHNVGTDCQHQNYVEGRVKPFKRQVRATFGARKEQKLPVLYKVDLETILQQIVAYMNKIPLVDAQEVSLTLSPSNLMGISRPIPVMERAKSHIKTLEKSMERQMEYIELLNGIKSEIRNTNLTPMMKRTLQDADGQITRPPMVGDICLHMVHNKPSITRMVIINKCLSKTNYLCGTKDKPREIHVKNLYPLLLVNNSIQNLVPNIEPDQAVLDSDEERIQTLSCSEEF